MKDIRPQLAAFSPASVRTPGVAHQNELYYQLAKQMSGDVDNLAEYIEDLF